MLGCEESRIAVGTFVKGVGQKGMTPPLWYNRYASYSKLVPDLPVCPGQEPRSDTCRMAETPGVRAIACCTVSFNA